MTTEKGITPRRKDAKDRRNFNRRQQREQRAKGHLWSLCLLLLIDPAQREGIQQEATDNREGKTIWGEKDEDKKMWGRKMKTGLTTKDTKHTKVNRHFSALNFSVIF